MKILYRIYEGTDFPTTVLDEPCLKTRDGDFVEAATGIFHSGETHTEVRTFVGQVWQIVDGSLLGVNSNYQNAKIPFLNCYITFEENGLYNDTEKIYYCNTDFYVFFMRNS